MSRVPPSLLYLAVYNPALSASGPTLGDDEDAEEQAQILFYTGRERAVSRDRILRQVGLAKALVNFTGMFSSSDVCENTHSQSKRMIMVSPEPNFWIHACIELAKSPRPVLSKGKGKATAKATLAQQVMYDYHDDSVHDLALRTQVLRGYEQFKLTHGSFTSILLSLGQEALELQLERFFTVWAWKWDLEDDMDLRDHLGAPMHSLHRSLSPILDAFSNEHFGAFASFILIPPYIVPSTRLIESGYPSVLVSHTLSRIPPPSPPIPQQAPSTFSTTDAEKSLQDTRIVSALDMKSLNQTIRAAGPFLNMNMDMRNLKWMWNGLTFSKASSSKPTALSTPSISTEDQPTPPQSTSNEDPSQESKADTSLAVPERPELEVDAESLREAITSENEYGLASNLPSNLPSPSLPEAIPLPPSPLKGVATRSAQDTSTDATPRLGHDAPAGQGIEQHDASITLVTHGTLSEVEQSKEQHRIPPLEFLSTPIHLASDDDPLQTTRHKIYHTTRGHFTFGVIATEDDVPDLGSVDETLLSLFSELESTLKVDINESEDMETPVAKILEPQTKHVISTGQYTSSSRLEFTSSSDHLYNGRQMLHGGFDIQEVFSRGQNPQHWHISRRGLGTDQIGESVPGEVFMEVARKESTLTDVDNELAGICRRFLE